MSREHVRRYPGAVAVSGQPQFKHERQQGKSAFRSAGPVTEVPPRALLFLRAGAPP